MGKIILYSEWQSDMIMERIEHVGNEYVVKPKKGKKILGKHKTYKKALKQLAAIEISKSKKS